MAKKIMPNEPAKSPKPNVFTVLKPYKVLIFILILFALLSNGVNLLIPKIISHAIDDFAAGVFSYRTIVLQFVVVAAVIFLFAVLQSIVQTYVSEKVARDMRSQLSDKISRQSFSFIQNANPSRLLTNLTSDMDSIKMFVSMGVVALVSSVFVVIAASILLLSIDWKLALCILAIIPVISGAFAVVFRKLQPLFKRSREVIDQLNKVINESILGAALIRVLNAQTLEYHKFFDINNEAKNLGISILRFFATLIPIVVFVGNMASLVILALGGHFVIQGDMSLGDFAAFSSYLAMLIFPIMVIGFISNFIAQASVAYGRISEVMNAPETADTGTLVQALKGNMELRNVNVKYGAKPVLKNVSLSVPAGSRTAIIGPTAAGKTQLLYLLTGLILPTDGNIFFDGTDLKEFDKEKFQHQIGFVFQDSIIFNLSLRENIAFNETVTDDLMNKAIETAELKDFISSLPDGIETVVSERGNSLSGGQKQRIMLARALALNPKILLLDDFTARVDNQTEKKILDNIQQNYPELTLLSVTQKIASVQHYNQIVVMEDGEILDAGTHEYLIENCTEYVQIFNSQRSTNEIENS